MIYHGSVDGTWKYRGFQTIFDHPKAASPPTISTELWPEEKHKGHAYRSDLVGSLSLSKTTSPVPTDGATALDSSKTIRSVLQKDFEDIDLGISLASMTDVLEEDLAFR